MTAASMVQSRMMSAHSSSASTPGAASVSSSGFIAVPTPTAAAAERQKCRFSKYGCVATFDVEDVTGLAEHESNKMKDHLNLMERKIAVLLNEKKQTSDALKHVTARCAEVERDETRARKENQHLKRLIAQLEADAAAQHAVASTTTTAAAATATATAAAAAPAPAIADPAVSRSSIDLKHTASVGPAPVRNDQKAAAAVAAAAAVTGTTAAQAAAQQTGINAGGMFFAPTARRAAPVMQQARLTDLSSRITQLRKVIRNQQSELLKLKGDTKTQSQAAAGKSRSPIALSATVPANWGTAAGGVGLPSSYVPRRAGGQQSLINASSIQRRIHKSAKPRVRPSEAPAASGSSSFEPGRYAGRPVSSRVQRYENAGSDEVMYVWNEDRATSEYSGPNGEYMDGDVLNCGGFVVVPKADDAAARELLSHIDDSNEESVRRAFGSVRNGASSFEALSGLSDWDDSPSGASSGVPPASRTGSGLSAVAGVSAWSAATLTAAELEEQNRMRRERIADSQRKPLSSLFCPANWIPAIGIPKMAAATPDRDDYKRSNSAADDDA